MSANDLLYPPTVYPADFPEAGFPSQQSLGFFPFHFDCNWSDTNDFTSLESEGHENGQSELP